MTTARSRWAPTFALLFLLLAAAGLAGPAAAQQAEAGPPPCSAAEYGQFDFWIGEWQVTSADGQAISVNRIERALGGCALIEDSLVDGEVRAHSLTYYDPVAGQWQHHWADCQGRQLSVAGGLKDGEMVLEGEATAPGGGAPVPVVGSWEVMDDGRVRQAFRASFDGGETWSEVFVGIHRRE